MQITKRLFGGFIAISIVLNTLNPLPAAKATGSEGIFMPMPVEAHWAHNGYQVDRLGYRLGTIGPVVLGAEAFIATPVQSCTPGYACDLYDIHRVSGTTKEIIFRNAPISVLDEKTFALSGHLVNVAPVGDSGIRYDVSAWSKNDGLELIAENTVFQNVKSVSGWKETNGRLFTNQIFNNSVAYNNAVVQVWDEKAEEMKLIHPHWYNPTIFHEEINDVDNDTVLITNVFQRGEEQLMFLDPNEDLEKRKTIPASWTDGDIVGAHFVTADTIQFFMNYVLHTYTIGDNVPEKHSDYKLNWYRDVEASYQLNGKDMAWVNPDDALYLTESGSDPKFIGTAVAGQFYLNGSKLFYRTQTGGAVYDMETGKKTNLPFYATHSENNHVVGLDGNGKVHYLNLEDKKPARMDDVSRSDGDMIVGFGTDPAVSIVGTTPIIYWYGVDAKIYRAAVDPKPLTQEELDNQFPEAEKIKTADNSAVYIIGKDGMRHALFNESVAQAVFGGNWAKDVVTVSLEVMNKYKQGFTLYSKVDYGWIK